MMLWLSSIARSKLRCFLRLVHVLNRLQSDAASASRADAMEYRRVQADCFSDNFIRLNMLACLGCIQ